ncbi:MAG: aminoacyl-tRNA hydrolase [Spirochaetaceae bacterium]|nr:aminoacyl-tRNA hydrolase [Spirochaetaceae bacterium]
MEIINLRRIFVGLGNPGEEYRLTRHNAGFLAIEVLSEKTNIKLKKGFFSNYLYGKGVYEGEEIFLVKPLTFMNRSGLILESVFKKADADLDNLVVICDNMDLYPGALRLKKEGGDAGHNGLHSIIQQAGTGNFGRFYIGIGRPVDKEKVYEHVLGIPEEPELTIFNNSINLAADYLLKTVTSSSEKVMNEVNRIKNIPNT